MGNYVALLRGINVGGHQPVKMAELQKAFAALEFQKVKTVLASGNVLFEASKARPPALVGTIENKLEAVFGHPISVLLRTVGEIQDLADARPFQKINVTPQTRLYVTFLSEKPKRELKIPYESPDNSFTILRVSDREVCSVLTLSPERQTPALMDFLEKAFGRNITTRNWNTITRILECSKTFDERTVGP